MMELGCLYFLIHGFCHDEIALSRLDASVIDPHVRHEREVANGWRRAVSGMGDDGALAIVPWPHSVSGPAAEFEEYASDQLGRRCFVLDTPFCDQPGFWGVAQQELLCGIVGELKAAFVGQRDNWNLEELQTSLHSLGIAEQLNETMRARGFTFDPLSVQTEAWGASFEGCVTKYAGNLSRLLGLTNPAEVNFDMTVPDAEFLLEVERWERIVLGRNLRLFLLECLGGLCGLFVTAFQSVGHPPLRVRIPLDPECTRVLTKFGDRLWPGPPEESSLRVKPAYHEPPQELVGELDGGLMVPVSGGLVYRRAKAPAFVFPSPEMGWGEFKAAMCEAKSGCGQQCDGQR